MIEDEDVVTSAEISVGKADPMPREIAVALVKAQAAAEAVDKGSTATMERYSYKYASAEAIVAEAREALAKAGLGFLCEGWRLEHARPYDRIFAQYSLVHESGVTWRMGPVSMPVIPGKGRPQDKAEATALTFALGYTLRGLLNLPRVEPESEVDQRDDSDHTPPPKPEGHDPSEVIQRGKHKGTSWADLPLDYLEWAVSKASGPMQSRAKEEMKRRQSANGASGLKARLAERKESRTDDDTGWDEDNPPPPADGDAP